jgi:uncharacterized damage-inducible protein DinB
MTPQQATIIFDFLYPQIIAESATTRKVLARVPEERCSYSPDAVSMNALKLASHIAGSEKMFLDLALKGEMEAMEAYSLSDVTSPTGVLEYFDGKASPLNEQLKALSPEQLTKVVKLGPFEMSVIDLLSMHLRHSIHHRGQLSAYLRSMGSKVPSIYGGSADEPFQSSRTS